MVALWLAFMFFGAPYIKSAIEKNLTYYPDDSIKIESLNLKFFPLGLELKEATFDLYLPVDTFLVKWQGNLSRAQVGGIDWIRAIRKNEWQVGNIEVGEGQVNWQVSKIKPKDTSRFRPSAAGKKSQPDILLKDIQVNKLDLHLLRDSFEVSLQTSIDVDSLSIKRRDSMMWAVKAVLFHSEDASFKNLVEDYDLKYQSLNFDSRDSTLRISRFTMNPRLSRQEFARKYPSRKVQPTLKVATIELGGIDMNRSNRGLFAGTLLVDSVSADIYQDLRKDRPDVYKPLPSQIIAEISVPISIDSIKVRNGFLKYQHQGKKEDAGLAILKGDECELNIYPISNIGHSVAADLHIDGNIRLMKEAEVTLQSHFLPGKTAHNFEVDVHMSPTPFMIFNDILYPTIGIKTKEGFCEEIRVHMYGNDQVCEGDLAMAYRDLKIAIPADQDELNLLGEIGEAVGNFTLVNSNNEMGAKNGNIYYKRNPNQPFIAFWWKSIQSGLLDTIIRFYKNPDKDEGLLN